MYYEGIKNREFIHYLRDIIAYGLSTYSEKYTDRYLETNMVIYKKYSRKDVCRLLNWDKDESGTINSYRVRHNTCPIFVTYKKSDYISDSTKYEDEFINKSTFSWITRHGLTIHLFIKKEDGEGKDFYYMGEMNPITGSARDTVIVNTGKKLPIVNILFRMKDQVQEDIISN